MHRELVSGNSQSTCRELTPLFSYGGGNSVPPCSERDANASAVCEDGYPCRFETRGTEDGDGTDEGVLPEEPTFLNRGVEDCGLEFAGAEEKEAG